MGPTLLGIDLDESPAGGLVERLLTDEEFEALTDGGRDADDATGRADDGADERRTDADGTSDGGGTTDADPHTDTTTDTTFVEGSTSVDDRSAVPESGPETAETPSPGGFRDRIPSLRGGEDAENGEDRGRAAKLKSVLPKVVAALVVVAVLAVVAKKYGGTVVGAVKRKLGRSDDEDSDEGDEDADVGEDVSVARRRAKATATDEDVTVSSEFDRDSTTGRTSDDSATDADARSRGSATDSSAIVGLAFLALVAALVRKFSEEREYDPLVDGPERE